MCLFILNQHYNTKHFHLINQWKSFTLYIINLELGVVAQAVISVLTRLTKEDHEWEASLG
jgi:hypothetical protein